MSYTLSYNTSGALSSGGEAQYECCVLFNSFVVGKGDHFGQKGKEEMAKGVLSG